MLEWGSWATELCVGLCVCVKDRKCTRQVTAAIHNCKACFFCDVAELEDCQGTQPMPPWYVDTVVLIHTKCVCVCAGDRGRVRKFSVNL